MPRVEAQFDPDVDSIRAARAMVVAAAAAWDLDDLADVAALLTSELVTNAVRHARTAFRLSVGQLGSELEVEVADASPTPLPEGVALPADGAAKFGLHLVQVLATRWGVRADGDGKVVWFVLRSPSAPPPAPGR